MKQLIKKDVSHGCSTLIKLLHERDQRVSKHIIEKRQL